MTAQIRDARSRLTWSWPTPAGTAWARPSTQPTPRRRIDLERGGEDRHGPSAGAAYHGGGGAPNTARVSARAGPIRASVGTKVGTRWEQIGSQRGCRCPLVSLRESGAVQGIPDENRGCRAARATAYGTEGQRFESSRARFVSQEMMRICRAFVSASADACPSLGSW